MIKFVDIKIGDDVTFYALIENMQKRFTPNKSLNLCNFPTYLCNTMQRVIQQQRGPVQPNVEQAHIY